MGWESTEQTSSSKRLGFSWNTKQLHLLQVLCYDRPPRSPNSEGWWFQTDVRTLCCSPPFSNMADKVTAFPVRWKGSSLGSHNESFTCELSDFRYGIDEVFALLCCYAAYVGNFLPTFRDSLSVLFSRVKHSKLSFTLSLPVEAWLPWCVIPLKKHMASDLHRLWSACALCITTGLPSQTMPVYFSFSLSQSFHCFSVLLLFLQRT